MVELGLECGSRWFKQGLEVGCKEEKILEILGVGMEPFLRAWMGAKVARRGSSEWLRWESGVRGVGPWGWVRCRLARGGLKEAMKWEGARVGVWWIFVIGNREWAGLMIGPV